MSTITFATLQFVKKLEARGFSHDQAEGINDALKDALQVAEAATKQDIRELEMKVRESELRLTIKLGALMAAAVSIVAALVKIL